jgi:hypothetical protein
MRDGSSACFTVFLSRSSSHPEGAFAGACGQHNGTMSQEAMVESPERALFGQCLASLKFILPVDGLGPTAAVQRGLVDS